MAEHEDDAPWHVEAAEWLANDDRNTFDTVHWLHEAIAERAELIARAEGAEASAEMLREDRDIRAAIASSGPDWPARFEVMFARVKAAEMRLRDIAALCPRLPRSWASAEVQRLATEGVDHPEQPDPDHDLPDTCDPSV